MFFYKKNRVKLHPHAKPNTRPRLTLFARSVFCKKMGKGIGNMLLRFFEKKTGEDQGQRVRGGKLSFYKIEISVFCLLPLSGV